MTLPTDPPGHVDVIPPEIETSFAETGSVGGIGLGCAAHAAAPRVADPSERELAVAQLQILETAAGAAHVREEEVVDVDIVSPVVPVARPELQGGLSGDDIAYRTPDLGEVEIRAPRTDRILNRSVGSKGRLESSDRSAACRCFAALIVNFECILAVKIFAERDFSVAIGFVAQPILRQRAGRLKAHHRAAAAVPAVTGAEIAMDVHEPLQHLLDPISIRMVRREQALLT